MAVASAHAHRRGVAVPVTEFVPAVPGAVWVVLLLGGPTLVWLVYRAASTRRSGRAGRDRDAVAVEPEFWLCPECLSLTPVTRPTCYACGFMPGRDDVDAPDGLTVAAGAGEQELREAEAPRPR